MSCRIDFLIVSSGSGGEVLVMFCCLYMKDFGYVATAIGPTKRDLCYAKVSPVLGLLGPTIFLAANSLDLFLSLAVFSGNVLSI